MKNQLKVDFTVGTCSFLGCVKNTLTLENTEIQGTVMVDPGLFGDVRKSNFTWN